MKSIPQKYNLSRRGFTMIEVMAAMLILSLVFIAYSQNEVGAIQLVKATRFRNTAMFLAAQKMAETDFIVQTKGIEEIRDDEKGKFEDERFEGFTWHIWKTKVAPPDFASLVSLGSGEEGSSAPKASFEGPMKMITDIWGKSIMELHLQVAWKEGEDEKNYTLMTHYMASDTNAQIQGLVGAISGGINAARAAKNGKE